MLFLDINLWFLFLTTCGIIRIHGAQLWCPVSFVFLLIPLLSLRVTHWCNSKNIRMHFQIQWVYHDWDIGHATLGLRSKGGKWNQSIQVPDGTPDKWGWMGKTNPTFYSLFLPNFLPYTHCPAFIYITFFNFTLSSLLSSMQYLLIGIGFSPCTIYRVWILPVEILDWSYCVILCESSNNKSKKYNLSKWRNIICLVDNMSGTRL